MKDGDEVYCIKDVFSDDHKLTHISGKSYIVDDCRIDNAHSHCYVTTEPESTPNGYLGFNIKKTDEYLWDLFDDHFSTKKKQRLLKLKKLNENRR
jgi:hypothetical protein